MEVPSSVARESTTLLSIKPQKGHFIMIPPNAKWRTKLHQLYYSGLPGNK
jgi:hypothetical protein